MVMSETEDGNIFKAEVIMNPPAAPEASTAPPEVENREDEEAQASIFNYVIIPGRVTLASDDFVDLWAHGLEIDNNNQLVPENVKPLDKLEVVGEWVLPQTCHQKMNHHFNIKGKWHNHTWGMISIYNELHFLFLTFLISSMKEVMLPKMNAAKINKITLREYISLLGLTFFMGYLEGILDHHQWFSKEPITVNKGAPFWLNE